MMDYRLLSKLDDHKLLEGMKTYYQNAEDLLETGRDLANQDKYGLATALTVLSIEELIKAYATFQVYIGETNPENINPAFSKVGDIHKTRLKLAYVLNHIFDLINLNMPNELIIQEVESLNGNRVNGVENTEEILQWIDNLVDKISPLVSIENIGIPDNFEVEIKKKISDHSNWYSAYTFATETFNNIGNPVKVMIEADDLKREIIRQIIKKIKNTVGNMP
jgi:AbiV family abortive infection protein